MHPFAHPIWWLKISAAIGRGDHQRVVDLAKSAIEKRPSDTTAYGFLVPHLEALGEVESAKGYARQALLQDPDNFDLHCFLVRTLDPLEAREEIAEHARWLLAIAETTLPKQDIAFNESTELLDRLPLIDKAWSTAKREMSEHRRHQVQMYRWAKAYLSWMERNSG